MADSTRAMRRSIFERELMPVWRNRLLTEITPDDLRAHCGKIVERGADKVRRHRDWQPKPPSQNADSLAGLYKAGCSHRCPIDHAERTARLA